MKRNTTLGLVAVFAALGIAVPSILARTQAAPPPLVPPQLIASHEAGRVIRALQYVSDTEYVDVRIGIDTKIKKVHLDWKAKNGSDSYRTESSTTEALSFTPTAICRSRVSSRGFFIAGRSNTAPVLEFWEFNADEAMASEWMPTYQKWKTTLQVATITKHSLPVSSSLGWPCEMTAVAPAVDPAVAEEVWVMEWQSRNVYTIAPTTGALTVRVPAATATPYRSMNGRRHSIYGDVVSFERKPWHMGDATGRTHVHENPALDVDELALYDRDLNGSMEGSFLIPTATFDQHPLYSTGEFTDDYP